MMFCFSASYCQEKQTVTLSQLQNTKWKLNNIWNDTDWYISFDKCFFNKKARDKGESKFCVDTNVEYYLSDTPLPDYNVSSFDDSKVGKSTSGSYIIYKMRIFNDSYDVDYYTIKYMSDSELRLVDKPVPGTIGGSDDVTYYYYSVKTIE